MSIQVLCLNTQNCPIKQSEEICVMPFDQAQAFDMFDLVVIDLQQEELWTYSGKSTRSIDSMAHFCTLKNMIYDSNTSRVIVLLPQNYTFSYDFWRGAYDNAGRYHEKAPLKDMLDRLNQNLLYPLLGINLPLAFGGSITECHGRTYTSDFHLASGADSNFEILSTSKGGGTTCFSISDRLFATTLSIENSAALLTLCQWLKLLPAEQSPLPDWLENVPFLNEGELRERRQAILDEAAKLENEKKEIDKRLFEYREKKAVLCTKDRDLENRAREMLAKILHVSSDFEDVREEDFRYETADCVFIFEIKGSIKGLKREHVSKTEDHVQICADMLEEKESKQKVKGILVFSSQIDVPPEEKDPYPQKQIDIARRYGVAIMSAETLLRCYEASERGNLSPNDFIEMLDSSSGLVGLPGILRPA